MGGGEWHASLWSGDAASWTDLHPAGASDSGAEGISGGQVVGYAAWATDIGDATTRASLWSRTADSWTRTDLNPDVASESNALGVSGGQQVGWADVDGNRHASLWSGSAASWTDLHPAGAYFSYAYGVSGGWQVGYADTARGQKACLWRGTAESWVDLHALLPPGVYGHCRATNIAVSGNDMWITGWAMDDSKDYPEAMLWHNVIPEPSSLIALASGLGSLGGVFFRRRRT